MAETTPPSAIVQPTESERINAAVRRLVGVCDVLRSIQAQPGLTDLVSMLAGSAIMLIEDCGAMLEGLEPINPTAEG